MVGDEPRPATLFNPAPLFERDIDAGIIFLHIIHVHTVARVDRC